MTSAPLTVPALDLHPDVTDGMLYEHFMTVGDVESVKICRDSVSGRSLGYGYANYADVHKDSVGLEKLNHTPLCGKLIRVTWSHRDPDASSSGVGNIFVKRSRQNKYIPNGRPNGSVVMSPTTSSNSHGGSEMLGSMLAAAAPPQQKQILGEHLFPQVHSLRPDLAAKITGMLLEMDNSELLLLLESPD